MGKISRLRLHKKKSDKVTRQEIEVLTGPVPEKPLKKIIPSKKKSVAGRRRSSAKG